MGGRKASFLAATTLVLSEAAAGLRPCRDPWVAQPTAFPRYALPEKPCSQAGSRDPAPRLGLAACQGRGAPLGLLLHPFKRGTRGRKARSDTRGCGSHLAPRGNKQENEQPTWEAGCSHHEATPQEHGHLPRPQPGGHIDSHFLNLRQNSHSSIKSTISKGTVSRLSAQPQCHATVTTKFRTFRHPEKHACTHEAGHSPFLPRPSPWQPQPPRVSVGPSVSGCVCVSGSSCFVT